ncbi:hypothetical protein JCM8115_002725 [Rhodotorula mucilaginosa]
MNSDYGLGSPAAAGGAASGTSTPRGGGGEQRAKDDHGEVEVQWGREKLRVPLPPPSSPLSHFRATLYNMTGVPPSHQKLIYAGAVLKDDLLPMSAYGLVESDPSSTSSSDPNAAAETSSSSKGRSFWDSWSLMGGRKTSNNKKGLKKLVMLGSATVSARVDDHLATRKDLQDLAAASPSGSVASAPSTTPTAVGEGGDSEKKVDSEETVQSRIRQVAVHKLDELEPQVKQVETWLAQEQARRRQRQQQATPDEEEDDAAPPPPPKRLLLYLSENLLQGLLKLDSIEIPSGYTEARKERKEAVRKVQEVLDRVDGAKEGWKQLGLSFS